MQKKLKDIHELDNADGCLLINSDGTLAHAHFSSPPATTPNGHDWTSFVKALGEVQEVDILFDDTRLHIRKTKTGCLLKVHQRFVPQRGFKCHVRSVHIRLLNLFAIFFMQLWG